LYKYFVDHNTSLNPDLEAIHMSIQRGLADTVVRERSNWADDGDSSEEEVEDIDVNGAIAMEALAIDIADDDDVVDDEDSDAEENIKEVNIVIGKAPVKQGSVKEKEIFKLTKKERKELQLKEIDDLDSVLSEFITAPVVDAGESSSIQLDTQPLEALEKHSNVSRSDNKKKKKKKAGTKISDEDVPLDDVDGVHMIVDINAILKSKQKPKIVKKTNEGVLEALKEIESNESKKKKKDLLAKKKTFNEFSM
jgi:hypothetical protein